MDTGRAQPTHCRLRSGSSAWVHSPPGPGSQKAHSKCVPEAVITPHLGVDQSSFPIMLPEQVGIFQESIPERRDDW